jgi:hypothetical protein
MTSETPRGLPKYAYALLAAAVLWLTWQHTPTVTLDDAYITYRYADNLAHMGRLVYNTAGPAQAFATTAPVYAVLLAALAKLGTDIPTAGGWLSIIAMIAAALALADLLAGWFPYGGLLAGLLLAALPMTWLALGMEGLPALALVLTGLALSRRRRDGWAALALGAATLFRFDAAAAALAWGVWLILREGWRSARVWRAAAIYLVTVIAVYGALMAVFGAPLPSTLGSKRAQVGLGITGFFSDTSYLEGLVLLARAYWEHSPWYAVLAVVTLAGFARYFAALFNAEPRARLRASPFTPLLLWTVLHLAVYVSLGVTPYVWYYLPVAPLVASFATLGLTVVAAPLRSSPYRAVRDFGFAVVAVLVFLGPWATHGLMDARATAAARGEAAAAPALGDKALPGTQYRAYRAAGEWLAANTAVTETVGVTEVGIMGYFSRRPMLDFLGLLDDDVSDALARGDMRWAMHARQPDTVALSTVNPTYAYNVYEDAWFQAAYEPLTTIPASGFWGGDLTIYRRRTPPQPNGPVAALPPSAEPLQIRFGDEFELIGYDAPPGPWRAGDAAGTVFYWRVLKQPTRDYDLFTHLLDADSRLVAGRDYAPLLGQRPTSEWQAGEIVADFEPVGLPRLPLAPTTLSWEIGFSDPKTGERLPAFGPDGAEMPGGQARFGSRKLLPATEPAVMSSGTCRVSIRNYTVDPPSVAQGGHSRLVLDVSDVTCPLALTADVWDWGGNRAVWTQTIDVTGPGSVEYTITAAPGDPASWPGLRLSGESSEGKLHMLDRAGHQLGDTLNLTPLGLTGP